MDQAPWGFVRSLDSQSLEHMLPFALIDFLSRLTTRPAKGTRPPPCPVPRASRQDQRPRRPCLTPEASPTSEARPALRGIASHVYPYSVEPTALFRVLGNRFSSLSIFSGLGIVHVASVGRAALWCLQCCALTSLSPFTSILSPVPSRIAAEFLGIASSFLFLPSIHPSISPCIFF